MQVFISYAFDDREIMNLMKTCLQMRGIKVYTAEHDPQLGKPLFEKIQIAIENSDALIAIVTRGNPSASVNQEVGYARRASIPVIPFVEKDTRIGFMLGDIERMQFDRNNVKQGCEKVASYIAEKLEPERREPLTEEELVSVRKIVDDYETFSYRLNEGSILRGRISSDTAINVFLVDTQNLNLFEDEHEFDYLEGSEKITRFSFDFPVPKTHDWHIIIENENQEPAEVDIKLKVISNQ